MYTLKTFSGQAHQTLKAALCLQFTENSESAQAILVSSSMCVCKLKIDLTPLFWTNMIKLKLCIRFRSTLTRERVDQTHPDITKSGANAEPP